MMAENKNDDFHIFFASAEAGVTIASWENKDVLDCYYGQLSMGGGYFSSSKGDWVVE